MMMSGGGQGKSETRPSHFLFMAVLCVAVSSMSDFQRMEASHLGGTLTGLDASAEPTKTLCRR